MGVCPFFSGEYCKAYGGLTSPTDYAKQNWCISGKECTKCPNFQAAVNK